MVREILTLSVGQGGNQLGNSIWKQYTAEHKVQYNGERTEVNEDPYLSTFFQESSEGLHVPRNLSVDLDATVIADIRRGELGQLFHPEYLLAGTEDAANNFARGMYTVGKEKLADIMDRVRHMYESADRPQGFLMNHSVGGGTGSGLGCAILERLALDYRKQNKFGFEIYPSSTISTSITEPYNGLIATHWLIDHTDISIVLDNQALYQTCKKKLDLAKPSYGNVNGLIAKVASGITASLRFPGELNADMSEFQTNMIPFPRLHFLTSSLAPVTPRHKAEHVTNSTQNITSEVMDHRNFLVDIEDFDIEYDQYMACCLTYRGAVTGLEANKAVQFVEQQKKATFVDWAPTHWKISLNSTPAATTPGDDLAPMRRNVTMLANNVGINRVFDRRLVQKFNIMYSQRAYVHWYVGEGMEEGEFDEAKEDLEFLQKDYFDCIRTESASSDDEESF